jgi:cytochrome c2
MSRIGLAVVSLALVGAAARAAEEPAPIPREVLAAADYVKGRTVFQSRCSACHALAEGSADLAGPALHGMFGRKAGGRDTFGYSDALMNAGFIWTPARLAAWLADPEGYLPGNIMMIPEAVPERDRINMVSFMMVETGAADWPRPEIVNANAAVDADKPYAERFPSFWNHMMFNTVRYAWERPGASDYVVDVYYNVDGSVTSNQPKVAGFWHIAERPPAPPMFCYALQGLAVEPGVVVECVPVAAMSIPRFKERLWQSKGYGGQVIHGGILPGRPEAAAVPKGGMTDQGGRAQGGRVEGESGEGGRSEEGRVP